MNNELIQKITQNRIVVIALCFVAAAGAIVTIAGGFYATYRAITFLSNFTI